MMCCRSALARRKEGQTTHLEMSGWVPLLSVDEARELERRGRREGKRDRRRKRRRDTHVGGRGGGRRGAREEGKGWRERGKEGGRRHACQHQYQNAYSSLIIEKTLERVHTSHFTLPPHPPCPLMHSLTKVGSRMKKMGVLFPTRSQFPSSV